MLSKPFAPAYDPFPSHVGLYVPCFEDALVSNKKAIVKSKDFRKITQHETQFVNDKNNESGVDKGLIAMFLKMSVEERLSANDNAVLTIQELRDAFQKRKKRGPQFTP